VPEPEGSFASVSTLAEAGTTLYIGGFFSGMEGVSLNGLAALNTATNEVLNWNPDVEPANSVSAIVPSGSTIYLAGGIFGIDGSQRSCFVAADVITGEALPFHPELGGGGCYPAAIAVSGSTAYLGGNFAQVGFSPGATRINLAAVDTATGQTTAWEPPAPDNSVNSVMLSGSKLLVGGDFEFVGNHITGPFTEVSTGAVPQHVLTVSKSGSGGGTITSSPPGIDCGSSCSHAFSEGTPITLTAMPATGSVFTGWSGGGCSGTGACEITLGSDAQVTAAFAAEGGGGPGGGEGSPNPPPAPAPTTSLSPASASNPIRHKRRLHCHKGFKKRKVHGKAKCVKGKHHRE
jgi:hypothetical protein